MCAVAELSRSASSAACHRLRFGSSSLSDAAVPLFRRRALWHAKAAKSAHVLKEFLSFLNEQ